MKNNCRSLCCLWLAALLSLWTAATEAHAIPYSELRLAGSLITVGSTFDVDVIVNGVDEYEDPFTGEALQDEVIAFGFNVKYTDTEFDYNGASVAAPFIDDNANPDPFTSYPDVAGSIPFFEQGPSGDNIPLASLNFTAKEPGVFSLGIITDLVNGGINEGLFTFAGDWDLTNDVTVTVAAAPVPEPGTLLLMIAGIGGLGFLKRKRL